MKINDFDNDTLITLARIAVIRSIIEDLYDDIDMLEYLDNAEATLYITTADDRLQELRDYIVKEANKNE